MTSFHFDNFPVKIDIAEDLCMKMALLLSRGYSELLDYSNLLDCDTPKQMMTSSAARNPIREYYLFHYCDMDFI